MRTRVILTRLVIEFGPQKIDLGGETSPGCNSNSSNGDMGDGGGDSRMSGTGSGSNSVGGGEDRGKGFRDKVVENATKTEIGEGGRAEEMMWRFGIEENKWVSTKNDNHGGGAGGGGGGGG